MDGPTTNPIDVMICSTCYDLADLRAELRAYLESQNLFVRVSEDPQSAFYVEPTGDSIETCLKNVEAANAIVVIIDRRYGPELPEAYGKVSATHAEILHAQKLGKPVFFFIREMAWNEYHQLRKDSNHAAKWVEVGRDDQRKRWVSFVEEQVKLPAHASRSNWFDIFRTSADLKPLVLRRLAQRFPRYSTSLAMQPDRCVRVVFGLHLVSGNNIGGNFRNLGPGPALSIRHGVNVGVANNLKPFVGGVAEGEVLIKTDRGYLDYVCAPSSPPAHIFCEYSNRFGDRYRIEVPVVDGQNSPAVEPERMYVRQSEGRDGEWIPV